MNFPSGPVVKNSLAQAGDIGSIPGLRRSHMSWGNWACAPQLPSLCAALHQEKPLQLETNALQWRRDLHSLQIEKARAQQKIQHSQK